MQTVTARVAQVFWGLIIVAADVHVGRFDLLPDFVGFVLIALGAAGLVGWSSHFQTASFLGWVMAPVSVALMLFHGSFMKLVWFLSIIVDGGLIWFLLGGVIAFAESKARLEWAKWASLSRRAYVGLLLVTLFTSWIAAALPTLARLLGSITFLATCCVTVVILYLLHRVKGEAAKDSSNSTTTVNPNNPFTAPNPPADGTSAPSEPSEKKAA